MTGFTSAHVSAFGRDEFYSFLVSAFGELNGAEAFSPSWHAEVLAAKLQGLRTGTVRRLIVNVPPRHLKSLAASVALPAWLLGHEPRLGVVNVTYAQDLSEKFARDCRAVMTAPWYQALFPTRLATAREPLSELHTTVGGFRLATSVGGVLTGRGADVIVIDDPLKPIDAMSASRRAAANDWFDFDPLFAAERQGQGRDPDRHAAPARGRSRRPRAETRGLGGGCVSRHRGGGRAARDQDAFRPANFQAQRRRAAPSRA